MIWFLPSVPSLMYFKIVFSCKRLITMASMIWFHPSVKSLMNSKFVFLCKSFVTFTTFIWVCLSMISFMTWHFFCAKALLQYLHLYVFSPLWILWCWSWLYYCESIITLAALILWESHVTLFTLIIIPNSYSYSSSYGMHSHVILKFDIYWKLQNTHEKGFFSIYKNIK